MNYGDWKVRLEGSKSTARRRKRYPSGSSDPEGSSGGSSSYSHRNKRKRRYQNHSHEEFKKAIPPNFNGEINNGQEAKAWLLGMRKYFQVQDYFGNMKARVSIFNLIGRASIWWEHFRKVKILMKGRLCGSRYRSISSISTSLTSTMMIRLKSSISWDWDNKLVTMEEYANKFLELSRYVRYIIDEKWRSSVS